MTKHYLIPSVGDGKTRETAFRPKYLRELGLSHTSVDFPAKAMFLCQVGGNIPSVFTTLESNADVISLEINSKSVRDRASSRIGVPISSGDDMVEKIVGTKHSGFTRNKFGVFV